MRHDTAMGALKRFWPVAVLLAALAALWASGLRQHLSWAEIGDHQAALHATVHAHPVRSVLTYTMLYAVCVTLSLPVGELLTAAAGLFFGLWLGTAVAVAGATLGAIGLFLVVRHLFADLIERRAGRLVARLRPRLERDGFSYLLALRLLPLAPFWAVNLAPALTGMRLAPYALATLIGIVPASFVVAGIGRGLGRVLASGHRPDFASVFTWPVLLPLCGLAALAMAPIAWRAWRGAADG